MLIAEWMSAKAAEHLLGIPARSIRRFHFREADTHRGKEYFVQLSSRANFLTLIRMARPDTRKAMIPKIARLLNQRRFFTNSGPDHSERGEVSYAARVGAILAGTQCKRPMLLLAILAHYGDLSAGGVCRAERKAQALLSLNWRKFETTRLCAPGRGCAAASGVLRRAVVRKFREEPEEGGAPFFPRDGRVEWRGDRAGFGRVEVSSRELFALYIFATVDFSEEERNGMARDFIQARPGHGWRWFFDVSRHGLHAYASAGRHLNAVLKAWMESFVEADAFLARSA